MPSGYPTAYRAGAKPYSGSQAFKGDPNGKVGSTGNPDPYNKSTGKGYGGPVIEGELFAPTTYREPTGPLHPPMTMAPTGNLPAVSAGARAAALRRAALYNKSGGLLSLAKSLYAMSQLAGSVRVGTTGGWGKVAECPTASANGQPFVPVWDIVQHAGPQPTEPDPAIASLVNSCYPALGAVTPPAMTADVTGYRSAYADTAEGNKGIMAEYYVRPFAGPAEPAQGLVTKAPLPLTWSGFPEVRPIQKPTAFPEAVPYSAVPDQAPSEYREDGPPPREPEVGLSDHHFQPMKGVKESKTRVNKTLWALLGQVTEIDEAIECAWKQLPKDKRSKVLGRKFAGRTEYYWTKSWAKKKGYTQAQIDDHNKRYKLGKPVHQTIPTMLRELAAAPEYTAEQMAGFQACQSQNAATDFLVGRNSQLATEGVRKAQQALGQTPRWLHLGTGPAL